MLVIPAIDLKDGKCVRLLQGDMARETVFSLHPEEMAERWVAAGAERLHLVDLDGAVGGRPVNRDAIRRVVTRASVPVELGGGIRTLDTLKRYLDLGIAYAILGTAAQKDPDFVETACSDFPGKIILGIDAKGGRVSVNGWMEQTEITPRDIAGRYAGMSLAAVVYTDIMRDGMKTGPNIEGTLALAESVRIPVIASGGISCLEDVRALLGLKTSGVIGMITGRALYDGALDLGEALRLAKA